MDNSMMLPVGTLLRAGTYKIEKQLSNGGFGNTYLVRNTAFGETMAMKEFFMKDYNVRTGSTVTVSVPDKKATFESQKEKLKKEAQRLRKLANAHLVRVHDLFEENATIYYVMDFINGETLAERLQRQGRSMTETEAMQVVTQMLDVLEFIHSQEPQLLHLDIKPANIMVDHGGCCYLIDFGSSKQVDSARDITVSSGVTMTRGYAPQELEDGRKDRIGSWTDLYELGATLYNLLTRQQPPTPSELVEDGPEAFFFPQSVSTKTRQLIMWMMTLSRKNRPQSVAEVRAWMGSDMQHANRLAGGIGDVTTDDTILNNRHRTAYDPDETDFAQYSKPDFNKKKPIKPDDQNNKGFPSERILLYIVGVIVGVVLLFAVPWGCDRSQIQNPEWDEEAATVYDDFDYTDSVPEEIDSVMVDTTAVWDPFDE